MDIFSYNTGFTHSVEKLHKVPDLLIIEKPRGRNEYPICVQCIWGKENASCLIAFTQV